MAYKRKRKRRVSKKKWLEDKIVRARKPESTRKWINILENFMRRPRRRKRYRTWSFNRKRY